jgi:hypothetical protein
VSLVLDSSATLAWIYRDETTDSIGALFDQVIDEGAIVPALWRFFLLVGLVLRLHV